MFELIKENKNGQFNSEIITETSSIPFALLMEDEDIISFQIVKSVGRAESHAYKNNPLKSRMSSVRRKDVAEAQKKKLSELVVLRQMKKEYLSKRIISLPEKYMVILSGLTTKAQEVFWVLYDSIENIDCNAIANKCHSKVVTINCAIKELKDSGLVIRVGSKKTGHYEIERNIRLPLKNNL